MNVSTSTLSVHTDHELLINSTSIQTKDVVDAIDRIHDSPVLRILTTIVLFAIVLSTFEEGRKALRQAVWSINSILGGSAHNVSIPGPIGLPVVGNIIKVRWAIAPL